MSMRKQILGVKKFTSNIKVLSELRGTLLKINISISKDFHLSKQTDTYSKLSKKKNLIQKAGFRI